MHDTNVLTNSLKAEGLTDKYKVVTTQNIIDAFTNSRWAVTSVRGGRRGFGKHVVRVSPDNAPLYAIEDSRLEVVIMNSYDGSSSFRIMLGVYRLVCSNGLIVGDTVESYRVRHVGNAVNGCLDAANKLLTHSKFVSAQIERMRSLDLSTTKDELVTKIWKVLELEGTPVISTVLKVRRLADTGNTAWHILNRVQENIIRGYAYAYHTDEQGVRYTRKTRAVNAIGRNTDLNRKLWDIFASL